MDREAGTEVRKFIKGAVDLLVEAFAALGGGIDLLLENVQPLCDRCGHAHCCCGAVCMKCQCQRCTFCGHLGERLPTGYGYDHNGVVCKEGPDDACD